MFFFSFCVFLFFDFLFLFLRIMLMSFGNGLFGRQVCTTSCEGRFVKDSVDNL